MAAVQSTSPSRESFFSDIALLINSLELEGYHIVRDAAVNNLMIGRIVSLPLDWTPIRRVFWQTTVRR